MNVSTIPAPVAAEISGVGSFFGSCQIAASGFESFLQSASVMPAGIEVPAAYGVALETPAETNGNLEVEIPKGLDIEAPKLANILSKYGISKEPKLLAQLQEILGEEAGAEEFESIKNFFQKYKDKFTAQEGEEDLKSSETMQIFSSLLKVLDSKYMSEIPSEEQRLRLLESVLKEIKKLLGYEQAQPEKEELLQPEMEAEIAQLETETPQPKIETEIAQPETEIPQPKAEAEIAQPETETPQPKAETEIAQPETKIPQPKAEAEIAQPETKIPQPKAEAEIAQPETKIPQPKAEAEIAQPETKIPQPKAETTQTEDELQLIKIEDPRIVRLAIKLGIEPEDREEFYELIKDLLEQGVISLDDLDDEPDIEDALVLVAPEKDEEKNDEEKNNEKSNEKKETGFLIDTLKELWECIKNGDTSKRQDFISLLKDITCVREFSKQLKESIDAEQKAEVLDKSLDSTSKKEGGFKDNELNIATLAKSKSREEKQAQPEVRAVWEGNGLKIEIVNPKTGEKLQSVPATGNTQERVNEYEVIRQVIARAKLITTPTGEQRLTIQLRPEHLGQLDLRIILNRGEMQIHARVESATAQQALENHIGLLREGLEKQGITLERLEVSIEQKDKQDAWSLAEKHERHEQKHGQKRNHRGRESHLAVSVANEKADTGRRLGYNTMEYLA